MLYTQGILIEPGDKYVTHLAIYHELLACYIILSYSTLLFKIYNFKTIVKTKRKRHRDTSVVSSTEITSDHDLENCQF